MAVGDKKPVVMESDIGQEGGVPPYLHASQHATGGADSITPSMIGAERVYYSLENIGCTTTSTVQEVWAALPNKSKLYLETATLTNADASWNLPAVQGVVIMHKPIGSGARGEIALKYKASGNGDYRMYLDDNNKPTGVWYKIATTDYVREAAASNPNLLDNWYLVDPINQRGKTEYVGTGYGIDRWRTNYSGDTVSVTANGVKNAIASTSVGWHLYQIVSDGVSALVDNKITASFLIHDTTSPKLRPLVSFRDSSDAEISNVYADGAPGLVVLTAIVPAGTAKIRFGFYAASGVASGDYVTIKAVKLELGSVQTLAHQDSTGAWVLNDPPPNKQQELAKCQRYQYNPLTTASYQVIGTAVAVSETQAVVAIPLPVPMRLAVPTLSISDATKLSLQISGSYIALTALSLSNLSNGCAKLVATVGSGLALGQSCILTNAGNNPTFILDANL